MLAPTAFRRQSSWRQISRSERFGDRGLARLPEIRHYTAAGDVGARPGVYLLTGRARFWGEMSSGERAAVETAVTKRYEALFRVSQTLISIRSSEELFSILARELRAVVNFYVMGVGIYDEKAHEMCTTSYGSGSMVCVLARSRRRTPSATSA